MTTIQITQIALEAWGAFFTLACAISAYLGRKSTPAENGSLVWLLSANTILLIADCFAYAFRGNPSTSGYYIVRISNFIVFLLVPLMAILFGHYMAMIIYRKKHHINRIWQFTIAGVCSLHILILIYSQFTGLLYTFDETNTYHRASGYIITVVLALLELLLLITFLCMEYKQFSPGHRLCLLAFILLPMASSLIQARFYGLSLNNIAETMSLLLLFLTMAVKKSQYLYEHQQKLYDAEIASENQKRILAEKEKELSDARLQVSLTMMQPHFIFNTLGSIEQLCRIDARQAAAATHNFSRYLRNNLHAIHLMDTNTLSDELSHIRSYIWLETMRFGEDLEFTEDLNTRDFRLPTLTLQPLIQHDVHRGLMAEDEGVIRIHLHSEENEERYLISIESNVLKNNTDLEEEKYFNESTLITIQERLQLLCKGSLEEEILPGKGCIFTITIPKDV